MAITASLSGRLRNTQLAKSRALLPLFEAVVNAIQAVDDAPGLDPGSASIEVRISRRSQMAFEFDRAGQPGYAEPIVGFVVKDNGVGFDDRNMESFRTLDSEYKSAKGCRGVGRLLWLKAFQRVEVSSRYLDDDKVLREREFTFTAREGVSQEAAADAREHGTGTEIRLLGFEEVYQKHAPKNVRPIARAVLEHCLWYLVRPTGAPRIIVTDGADTVNLTLLYEEEYILDSSETQQVLVKGRPFFLTHLKLKTGSRPTPELNWCAANRVVFEENLSGKVPGLHGKLRDGAGEFMYASFLESSFLDASVRSERTGFEIPDVSTEDNIDPDELSMADIRAVALSEVERYLHENLAEVLTAGRSRVEDFVAKKAPRYRPILRHLGDDKLSVDPGIGDKDLELQLHRHLADIEAELLEEGQEVLSGRHLQAGEYDDKLRRYLEKVDDVKKSDLAAYVSRRRVILDLLDEAIQADRNGRYAREDAIHTLIMPMRATSDDVHESASNLWVIDEGLAFHDYLASDKPIRRMPITGSDSALEPDLLALQVWDGPVLVAAGKGPQLGSIVVVEIKRPMRNDAAPGPEKDPVSQALRYLKQVRDGKVMTASGRPIRGAQQLPGFCYVVADLTPTMIERCMVANYYLTPDEGGFFGYNHNYQSYVEVISFDRLLEMARRRNHAFFDRLGLPVH